MVENAFIENFTAAARIKMLQTSVSGSTGAQSIIIKLCNVVEREYEGDPKANEAAIS